MLQKIKIFILLITFTFLSVSFVFLYGGNSKVYAVSLQPKVIAKLTCTQLVGDVQGFPLGNSPPYHSTYGGIKFYHFNTATWPKGSQRISFISNGPAKCIDHTLSNTKILYIYSNYKQLELGRNLAQFQNYGGGYYVDILCDSQGSTNCFSIHNTKISKPPKKSPSPVPPIPTIGKISNPAKISGGSLIGTIFNDIFPILYGLVAVIVIALISYAGFLWMTSGGDTQKIARAKAILTGAVIGVSIIALAYAISLLAINLL
jgi:hypothetical protein